MERALAIAERTGHTILFFLMGLENLSQKELDLYNKGMSAEENERAVHECRRSDHLRVEPRAARH